MAKGFFETLRELRGGLTIDELSGTLADVVRAVEQTGKAGELRLRLRILPSRSAGGTINFVTVSDEITTRMPKPDRHETVFFPLADGSLSMQHPGQLDLTLRPVPTSVDIQTDEIERSA